MMRTVKTKGAMSHVVLCQFVLATWACALSGCDNGHKDASHDERKWVEETADSAALIFSMWKDDALKDAKYLHRQCRLAVDESRDEMMRQCGKVIASELEYAKMQRCSHRPLFVRIRRTYIPDSKKKWEQHYYWITNKLLRLEYKYELNFLTIGSDLEWNKQNLYFVHSRGNDVCVISSRVEDIAPNPGGRGILPKGDYWGDFGLDLVNLWYIPDDGFRGYSDCSLPTFLKGLANGETSLYWGVEYPIIPYGRYVYDKAAFEDWLRTRNRPHALRLKLIVESDDAYLFSAVADDCVPPLAKTSGMHSTFSEDNVSAEARREMKGSMVECQP